MGKAGKRQEMVEDRSSERVLCEKVYTMYLKKYVWVLWRWWKADCVKKVRMRDLRVWESCLWEGCVWASCVWESVCDLRGDGGRQIVWKRCVWESCVRESCGGQLCVRALCVKELCVKWLCGMCGQRQFRQDHRGRSSRQLLVLAAKQLIIADRLLPGLSWKLTVHRKCLRQAKGCFSARASKQPLAT